MNKGIYVYTINNKFIKNLTYTHINNFISKHCPTIYNIPVI